MLSENKTISKRKMPKKITPQRLKNIALYYLKRFETSAKNLRDVLCRRVDKYAYYDKEFDKKEAYGWVDDLVEDFIRLKYVDDARFAEIKVRGYLLAGKSPRYILGKLKEKGVSEDVIEQCFVEQEYSAFDAALKSNPRNYIAYSNLSIAYYKMGKYDEGLRVVQNLIKSQYLRDMPSDIKGYTYFNAALCRTAMGDAASDESARQQHYDMAMKNLRLAQKFSPCRQGQERDTLLFLLAEGKM